MRLTSSRAYMRPAPVPKMPPGLEELMNGLARDVLFHNPTNVYEFCANHMEKLLEIRDGPSLKTSLTLEQKIQKAQDKLRLKAKERREKFDRDTILKSTEEGAEHDREKTPYSVHQGSPEIPDPDLRALVHHDVDLRNESEVEISHTTQAALTKKNQDPKLDEINDNKDIENYIDKEAENQAVQTISLRQIDLKENNVKSNKEVDNEPIFGKVDSEMMNLEVLKITMPEEIVDINAVDSSLHTIKEASEEDAVNGNATVLPRITIGDEHNMRELNNISEEFVQEESSDIVVEVHKKDVAENDIAQNVVSPTESRHVSDKLDSNDVLACKTSNNDINALESTPKSENIESGSVHTKDNDISYSDQTYQNQNDTPADITVKIPNTDNVQPTTDCGYDKGNAAATEIPIKDIPDEVVPLLIVPEVKSKLHVDDSVNERAHEAMDEKQLNIDITENKCENNDTENKITLEVGDAVNANMTNIDNSDPIRVDEIGVVNMETEAVQHPFKVTKENYSNDYEKHQDNIETSLHKSHSTENTNEDSISMIESDISKTDDDSTQNNPNMDLETAAVTIQKVFRSFMFKSRNSEDNINEEHNSVDEDNDKKEEYYAAANLNKERRPLGITRMDTVLQTVNEEKSLSLSTDDSSTLSSAATTIQAHVRGFLVRNRLNSSKTYSMNSLVNSHEALEADSEQHKSKTILNIHIVPEEGNYLSRDESLITSMELSLDGSPPSSVNLHPLSCDITERRKMLKREDAVQSVTPPSNNSGKLSEDSVKEFIINENGVLERELTDDKTIDDPSKEVENGTSDVVSSASTVTPTTIITISNSEDPIGSPRENTEAALRRNVKSFTKLSSDESDVITPFVRSPRSPEDGRLLHSGEFHDVVLPTKVSRNDTTVVRGE